MQSQSAGFPPAQPPGYPPYPPPPPASDSRLPWPPPPGSQPPASLPPAGQAPPPPPVYGAPVPADTQFDTQRMLQPQGLFQSPRPPEPWPASGPGSNLFAPPLPGGTDEGLSATLPRGMDPVPPGGPYQPGGGPYQPGGQFQPGDPYQPGGPLPPGGPKRQRKLPGGPMAIGIVAAVIVALVAAIALLNRHGSGSGAGGAAAGGTTPTATASAATMSQQRQAAVRLSGLLPQSGTDRADVIDAVENVHSCGKNLGNDARVFTTAAGNRRALVAKLASLSGRSALPAAMLTDLSGAWQASAQVDTDLAQWAATAASHGCHKGNPKDHSLQASYGPDGQATAGKQAFARLWNPLARRYGLRTYRWEQL